MIVTLAPYGPEDYPLLEGWWKERGFPPANPKFMAPTGRIAWVDAKPVAAAFLFKSDANAAIIGNIVSDPKAPGEARSKALDLLIDFLALLAKLQGFGMVCCSTNLPRLMERFKKHGFDQTDEGVSCFGRIL